MSNEYFSYIRVSTQRQGQQGTSLTEQTAAIDRYAKTWNLPIKKRFEERETAAKQGRPVFLEMVKALKERKARGVIIHKIDRSARNLRDWAELGGLIDLGIEVHFVNESLDLNSRGGRLSADIQAVVASDYIRNLREETIKGIHGRIKQGLYPFPAPPGYRNSGSGKPKEIDPVSGPLIKQAYELYASGKYSLLALTEEMFRRGLRTRGGGKVSKNALHDCLRNPFYMGLIKVRTLATLFVGQHSPLVSKRLFDLVQTILSGKSVKKQVRHFFLFRRMVRCSSCRNFVIAERQKGHVYYRCHTSGCKQAPIREEELTRQFLELLSLIEFNKMETERFRKAITKYVDDAPRRVEKRRQELLLRKDLICARLEKLADAYVDGVFDKELFASKQNALTNEKLQIEDELVCLDENPDEAAEKLREFLELANSACSSFISGNDPERREFLEIVISNAFLEGKTLIIEPNSPFDVIVGRHDVQGGCPIRDTSRTKSALLSQVFGFFLAGGSLRERSGASGWAPIGVKNRPPFAQAS
ncbi:MAG: recombinase family protein [Acidobacteria bacterium]|nr:recombinase family protein [Acidobacteriota bacterium]